MKPKKLIEVAMPIKEISAESVRDKSIRHGHISTLHLWWARRPLPVCRAVVFASLVPDPLDENCPQAFKDAVASLLKGSLYKPYDDIPYTSVIDRMDDNLRHRLMMFIGKFSNKCQANMIAGKSTSPADQLAEGSLIKWENKNNEAVLGIARKLIWVAFHAERDANLSFEKLSNQFDKAYQSIKEAEKSLYDMPDRHLATAEVQQAEAQLKEAIDAFQQQMPSVFDPFAGGGAIPLEAARLGCRSFGNDINPVAHIIERGSAEFPQRYGKPIRYSETEFRRIYGEEGVSMLAEKGIPFFNGFVLIPNRLAWDVEFYAKRILRETEKEVGWMYPADENGNKPIAFYWVRTAKCSNPSCGAEVPMLKGFDLVHTNSKQLHLEPTIDGNSISFSIVQGRSVNKTGWNNRGNITCPCCGNITSVSQVKEQSKQHGLTPRLIATIYETPNGKSYGLPTKEQESIVRKQLDGVTRPIEAMQRNSNGGDTFPWGFTKWGDLFTDRQLFMLQHFIEQINRIKEELLYNDYGNVIATYLTIWFDRIALINTSFSRYDISRENVQHMYNRQAIAMVSDFPESNPFCESSGCALNQLDWILRYLDSESYGYNGAFFSNASSGDKEQFEPKQLAAVVTDPPYYDAIAYGDISDFFYIWMKKTLGEVFPLNFTTPLTPKIDECTALKHHHNDSEVEAKKHFEHKLTDIFDAIERQTTDVVSIMFAHQSTEAWTTLCNSILNARMNITGSWPMDTELANRTLANAGSALESSVTVSCRPSQRQGFAEYKDVKKAIEKNVHEEVNKLYELGFRGADLLTACFGQAVSEFGKYETVEKSNGDKVTVAELLELAREAAFNALIEGVQGDNFTKFYLGWLQLNGMGETDYDDVTKFTRVGLPIDIKDVFDQGLLVKEPSGNKQHLATAAEHLKNDHIAGTHPEDLLIDQAHRAILVYKDGNRTILLRLLRDINALDANAPFWRLLASLKELLPANDDLRQVQGLLQNGEDLRQASRQNQQPTETQTSLEL
jgi:adenine-specific DNA methylase